MNNTWTERWNDRYSKEEVDENEIFKTISIEELNSRIDKSEDDFKNGRYKTTSQLLEKYK